MEQYTECVTLRNIMLSAAEAEVGTIYHNGKVAIPVRTAIIEMVHPQGPTPLKTNNKIADGFFNKKIKLKRSKCFKMKFHWMKNGIIQGTYYVYWDKGINNWADHFTEHQPHKHHKFMRLEYI